MTKELQQFTGPGLPAHMVENVARLSDQPANVVQFVAKQLAFRFSNLEEGPRKVAAMGALQKVLTVSGLTKPADEVMQDMAVTLARTYPAWGPEDPHAAWRAYIAVKLDLADEKAAEFYGGVMNPKPLFYIFAAYDALRRKVHAAIVNEQAREKEEAAALERKARGAALVEADKAAFLAGRMFPEPVVYTDPRLDWLMYDWAKEAGYCEIDARDRREIWERAKALATAELAEERDRLTTLGAALNEESVRLRATMIGKRIILADIVIPALILENMPLPTPAPGKPG